MKYYECGICDHLHPWEFNGDCRDDKNRFSTDIVMDTDEVLSWEERQYMDNAKLAIRRGTNLVSMVKQLRDAGCTNEDIRNVLTEMRDKEQRRK